MAAPRDLRLSRAGLALSGQREVMVRRTAAKVLCRLRKPGLVFEGTCDGAFNSSQIPRGAPPRATEYESRACTHGLVPEIALHVTRRHTVEIETIAGRHENRELAVAHGHQRVPRRIVTIGAAYDHLIVCVI